jgi:alkanesulfonate monooxygenase SsuD/methylene tetrahydromethanopterin reductase-like flavin-dependent oxidoreductase (luciferase family)
MPQGWRWLDSNGSSTGEQYQFAKNIVSLAEELGYDTAYSYDHLMGGANFRPNRNKNFFECFVLISSLLSSTSTLRFGQLVTCNSYRNPALLAKMISTMDIISGGRIELGIGAGWFKNEYHAYGYDYPPSIIRIQQLEEALTVIKLMYTQDEPSFLGKYYSIVNADCYPRPIQKPYPPILVGGTGEEYLLKTVTKHANIYNHPFAPPGQVKRRLDILQNHCDSNGRKYEDIERSVVFRCLIRETENQISDLIQSEKSKDETNESFIQRINAIVGTPEFIKRKVYEYIDIGIEKFIIHFVSLDKISLELFYSEVIRKV